VSQTLERRRERRADGGGVRAKARHGHRLVVVDVSSGGALVEAVRPLRPGAQLEVQIETDRRTALVRAEVVRCAVAALDAAVVTYRAGLAFSETCDWVSEAATRGEHDVP
jgi:hypothetical protein